MFEVVFYSRRTSAVYRRRAATRREAEEKLRRGGMSPVPKARDIWQSDNYFAKIREKQS